jgi:NADPH:quinone reductase-like Zn-dependent oxidoreductase
MAKIVRFHQIGGPDVLNIEEAPSREPGKGEAKLRVRAIGLNRAESMFMHGSRQGLRQLEQERAGLQDTGIYLPDPKTSSTSF